MATFEIDETLFARLKDKVVIITGGATGIGRATATLFAQHGAQVIVADLNTTETRVEGTTFVEVDVTSWPALCHLFQSTYTEHGRIDIVFANAGVARSDNYMELAVSADGTPLEPSHRTLNINLTACINTVALAIHYMKQQQQQQQPSQTAGGGGGNIIVTASASSYQRFLASDYATAKHGVIGLMRSLVDQLPPHGIRVNAIAPSWTDTRMVPKAALAAVGVQVQSTEVVARSVALLAVDEARHGQTIYSCEGRYREVEGPLLRAAREVLEEDEGEALLKMLKSGRDVVGLNGTPGKGPVG